MYVGEKRESRFGWYNRYMFAALAVSFLKLPVKSTSMSQETSKVGMVISHSFAPR